MGQAEGRDPSALRIPTRTFALDPNRANLVARLKGNGTKRPLPILAHTDVVGVDAAKWPVDPFGAVMTRVYFERLAAISAPDKAARYRALLDPLRAPEVQRYLAEHEPKVYSTLRTSVVPTMLKAGVGMNVILSEAEATLDIRALPGEDGIGPAVTDEDRLKYGAHSDVERLAEASL